MTLPRDSWWARSRSAASSRVTVFSSLLRPRDTDLQAFSSLLLFRDTDLKAFSYSGLLMSVFAVMFL